MEGRVTEENSTYLQYLKLNVSPKQYQMIKPDYLTLANGDTLSQEDPFFPLRSRGFRHDRIKFSYFK